ncbi:hypothetical protein [Tropheryma whipplei]|uniref:hypothetical protein n=1 Tax=Tropheryma whipplei TaxID=2039 RepID=UPI001F4C7AE6|nr:hypothetical protein [Tropheryma whipplei]
MTNQDCVPAAHTEAHVLSPKVIVTEQIHKKAESEHQHAGQWMCRQDTVGAQNTKEEMRLTDIVEYFYNNGLRVNSITTSDSELLLGVNNRVQLAKTEKILNDQIIKRWQLYGVTIKSPETTWIDSTVQLSEDVLILPGCILSGRTRIEEGAVIGPFATISDSFIGKNTIVKRAEIIDARIEEGAVIGPFAFIRPGTVIGKDSKVGTFVEIKQSNIGPESKVPHLSYIGDANIGSHVNIGAGNIFANYDGKLKHETCIDDGVKTGAGNVFVAPVKVGRGAYTGAGSVIRDDIEEGALSLTELKQKTIPKWAENRGDG